MHPTRDPHSQPRRLRHARCQCSSGGDVTASSACARCREPFRRLRNPSGVDPAGGEGGIRTPDTVARMPHFECGAFDHSATSPRPRGQCPTGRALCIQAQTAIQGRPIEPCTQRRRCCLPTESIRMTAAKLPYRLGSCYLLARARHSGRRLALRFEALRRELRGVALALLMVAVTTVVAWALIHYLD